MATLSDERGQALVVAVLVIAIAAAAIVGLRDAQQRILSRELETLVGEATVAAAASGVADAYVAWIGGGGSPDVPRILKDSRTLEAGRLAAAAIARANGFEFDESVEARCAGRSIEVDVRFRGRRYRAAFDAGACSPR